MPYIKRLFWTFISGSIPITRSNKTTLQVHPAVFLFSAVAVGYLAYYDVGIAQKAIGCQKESP